MAQIKRGRWLTAAGQSVSSALKLGSETLVGFYTPAALTAASLKIQASHDGAAFADVTVDGEAWSVPATAGAYLPLDPVRLLGVAQVRVAHLTAGGAAAAEAAERVLLPVFRAFE